MRDVPAHANFDPVVCLVPGLFRSLRRGSRRQALTLAWPKDVDATKSKRAGDFVFSSGELLGADDLRVLQGVLAFASRKPLKISAGTGGDLGRLRARLDLKGAARDADALLVTLGYAELARAVGYGSRNGRDLHGGGLSRKVQKSLDRLAGLSVAWTHGRMSAGWRFLAWDDRGARGRKLRIALNPRAGHCALGTPPFARIDLAVARRLKSDPARLMHQRLSAWMDRSGEPRKIGLERLAAYPWSPDETGASCLRKRRWTLKQVITELTEAGWQVDEVEGRSALRRVSRPGAAPPKAGPGDGQMVLARPSRTGRPRCCGNPLAVA